MNVLKQISVSRFFAQAIFLLLPTVLVVMFILWNSNLYFTLLREQWFTQTIYFAFGLFISFFLAQFRFRFLPLFAILIILFFSVYQLLDNYSIGEFDSFFISIQFLVFAYLFSAGWLCGWGLQRISFFPIILSAILLLICIFLIAKTGQLTSAEKLLSYLTPVVIYAIYIIYTNESLRNTEKTSGKFWWRFSSRLVLFCSLLLLLFGGIIYLMYPEINERVEEYGGGGKEGENQMLETKKDGTVENKQSMGMGSNNKRDKNPEPLFCAHIDNYLPGTDIPNPLYLTSWHFTKFDTLTETFERDSSFVFNDEFQPDPSKIQLFSTFQDSSRIQRAFGNKHKKTIEIEVYKKRLSSSAFVAPSTSYWVQPITVEKEFQKEFSSAYRSKSYVSDLNSAYFIYNTDNPDIVEFQKGRFEELRLAKDYSSVDEKFMRYYTFFPGANKYAQIKVLADSLSKNKKTTIDKVLSIRDYFLMRNELGEKTFKYTDNPGVPGLPGASKLMNFLFESKQGYCAYYAGATLFMLRAMGIPSRIVTGFLTVDRSDKNTGWYWFYEDQSHGWVQVYFPEYGWIDFDTTVGNDEAQQSPKPDGTPPMQPPNPVMAMGGQILSVDTLKKTAKIHIRNFIFKDIEFKNLNQDLDLDLSVANFWKDSIQLTIQNLSKGNQVMAVSFREKLKAVSQEKNLANLLTKLPRLLPIDEVYIKPEDTSDNNKEIKSPSIDRPITFYIKLIGLILIAFSLLLFTIPITVYQWYKRKIKSSKTEKERAYYNYRAATFLLNQLNIERKNLTPWQFATQIVDKNYQTNFSSFMNIYLKTKYTKSKLKEEEAVFIQKFYPNFESKILSNFKIGQRISRFLNLNTFVRYYYLPEPETNN